MFHYVWCMVSLLWTQWTHESGLLICLKANLEARITQRSNGAPPCVAVYTMWKNSLVWAEDNNPFPLASLQNDDEDFNYVIAFFLGTAACLYQVSDGQWANDGPLLNTRDSAACQQEARQQRSLISTWRVAFFFYSSFNWWSGGLSCQGRVYWADWTNLAKERLLLVVVHKALIEGWFRTDPGLEMWYSYVWLKSGMLFSFSANFSNVVKSKQLYIAI